MMFLYNISIRLYALIARIVGIWSPKAKLWSSGRRGLLDKIKSSISPSDRIVWIHVASLGEFEQGRPIIENIRRQKGEEYKILLTFFSPSGYEIRRNYDGADYIFYLPLDTPRNAKRFLNVVKPEIAIFVKYEFWLNMLFELRARNIKSYIVSAIFRSNSIFFKWYGYAWRKALETFEILFVQDENSRKLLSAWGFDNAIVAGDTRFDRVWDIAQCSRKLPIIENFVAGHDMMIAGSSWEADEEILLTLIDKNPDVKFIIAPHEIDNERIAKLSSKLAGKGVTYSSCVDKEPNFEGVQVIVLDTMGMLSSVYKYAKWGYIGGGFGKGIHNTLEAATFGLPIAFGPNYLKFKEACDLISIGVATSVTSFDELDEWFTTLHDKQIYSKLNTKCLEFTARRRGATELITKSIFNER